MTKCYICEKGKLIKKKVDFDIYGISIGKFPAEVCNKCNEEFFDEQTSDKIDETVKARGLWGLEAKTKIGKVGDALDVRFNKKLVEFLKLKKGEEVTVKPETKKKIIVELGA